MRANRESRLVLIGLAIIVVALFLLSLYLGALLRSQPDAASDTAAPPSTDPAALPTDQSSTILATPSLAPDQPSVPLVPATTEPAADADLSATPPAVVSTAPGVTQTPAVAPPSPAPSATVLTPTESSVTAPSALVYDGPSTSHSVIGGVERDDMVTILGSSGEWYLVRVSSQGRTRIEGGQGWIPQDAVNPPTQIVPEIAP